MSKFYIFQTNQRLMGRFGIYQTETNPCDFSKSLISYSILCYLLAGVIAYFMIVLNSSYELSERLRASFVLIAVIQASGIFHNMIQKMEKISHLHNKLQSIVDKGSF